MDSWGGWRVYWPKGPLPSKELQELLDTAAQLKPVPVWHLEYQLRYWFRELIEAGLMTVRETLELHRAYSLASEKQFDDECSRRRERLTAYDERLRARGEGT